MSNREMCVELLDAVPKYKMGYVLAYLQGITAGEAKEKSPAKTGGSIDKAGNS